MGFFARGGGQDDEHSEALARIEAGGISHGWGSHVIEFFALGTAIVSTGEETKIEPPVTVLDLNDPRPS